jgi:hypothetical protein
MFGQLPGAHFYSEQAVNNYAYAATRYENIVAQYDFDGDEADLWESLRGLGFDRNEIQWHVAHRGERMQQGYM